VKNNKLLRLWKNLGVKQLKSCCRVSLTAWKELPDFTSIHPDYQCRFRCGPRTT